MKQQNHAEKPRHSDSIELSDQEARLLDLAERLARERHAGQVDKGGEAYWTHPQRVSADCATPQGKIAGWLHDLLEDTDTTAEELLSLGFPQEIVSAVKLDTRRSDETYMDYIRRICLACNSPDPTIAAAGRIAREVKLSDLADNMNLSRLPIVTDADLRRLAKYRKARQLLGTPESMATETDGPPRHADERICLPSTPPENTAKVSCR